jgi:hypothetical protein
MYGALEERGRSSVARSLRDGAGGTAQAHS